MIEFVARELDMPSIRVQEVASFYTMFNLAPVGKYPRPGVRHDAVHAARVGRRARRLLSSAGMKKGHTTADGLFTLTEVECLGACANAPMVQINDDNYEDLTADSMGAVLDALAARRAAQARPADRAPDQRPEGGPTTLKKMAERNYDYRGQW